MSRDPRDSDPVVLCQCSEGFEAFKDSFAVGEWVVNCVDGAAAIRVDLDSRLSVVHQSSASRRDSSELRLVDSAVVW